MDVNQKKGRGWGVQSGNKEMNASEDNKLVYITQHTSFCIIKRMDLDKQEILLQQIMTGDLYTRPLYLFSQKDLLKLYALRAFFQDPEKFIICYYKRAPEGGLDPDLVFPEKAPAYHLRTDCKFLHQNYFNVRIPEQIKMKGDAAKEAFREFFRQYADDYEKNRERFNVRLSGRFNMRVQELENVNRPNSGVAEHGNEDLDKIGRKIDRLLDDITSYWSSSAKTARILNDFQLYSGLGYSDKPLDSNYTGFSDKEVKALLMEYSSKYKDKLRSLLQTWLRVKFNPDLQFQGKLMDQLGVKKCKNCGGDTACSYRGNA